MKNIRELRVAVGGLIWLGLLALGVLTLRGASSKSPGGFQGLIHYACNQRLDVPIEFDSPQWIAVGDLVFIADKSNYAPVGYVSRAGKKNETSQKIIYTDQATVTFYGMAPPLSADHFLTYHMPADDTAWVIETMFPPDKRREISRMILEAYTRDRETIAKAIGPVIARSLSEAAGIVKEDLQSAITSREEQLRQIGKKYQREIIEAQLLPLLREEIWPIMQEEGEPLALKIGQEIWREVSVMRFAWRYVYDRSVGPEVSLTQRELVRFVETKVLPIIQTNLKELLQVQRAIVTRVARNERVQETLIAAAKTVSNDPQTQQIVKDILQEAVLSNERLRQSLRKNWNSPEAIAAIDLTSERLEPTLEGIGAALFGSTDDKITPEFARVLRHRILRKDSRWLTLHTHQQAASVSDSPLDPSPPSRPTRPAMLPVRVAVPTGAIPYAPARER